MTAPGTDPRRRNRGPAAAADNRRALIAAGREVFATEGLRAPFSAVAKRAGVGQGTLYRHFPDRLALAVAVFDENLSELERTAGAPHSTLGDLLDEVAAQALPATALVQLLMNEHHDPRVRQLAERYEALIARLLDRERAEGHVGPHIEPADVAMATAMLANVLAHLPEAERDDASARGRRLFRAAFEPR